MCVVYVHTNIQSLLFQYVYVSTTADVSLLLFLFQSVWGSYWVEGKWGYSCCHSLIRNSFCTGEAGKRAARRGNVIGLSKKKREEDDIEEEVTSLVEVCGHISACLCTVDTCM